MTDSALPEEVRRLIDRVVASMDHVEVLIRLYRSPDEPIAAHRLAAEAHIQPAQLERVIHDLEREELIAGSDGLYHLAASPSDRAAVDRLGDMYNTRPVTLIRAIYARLSPVNSFADAFRLRRND